MQKKDCKKRVGTRVGRRKALKRTHKINQARGDGSLDQGDSSWEVRCGEGQEHLLMGLQVELRKGRCQDNSKVFGTSNWESGSVAY